MIELETEITDAIAVFERDLARARSRRIEKERAEAPLPIHPSPPKPQLSPSHDGGSGSLTSSPEVISKSELPDSDVVMVERNPGIGVQGSSEPDEKVSNAGLVVEEKPAPTEIVGTEAIPAVSESAGLAIDLQPGPALIPKVPSPQKQPSPQQQENDDFNISDIPDIPTADMDFESMFDDLDAQHPPGDATGGGATEINFDLDFSGEAFTMGNETTVPDASNGATNTANDLNAVADHPREDINTLLPGLENLVGDTSGIGDIAMIDIPATTSAESNGVTSIIAQAPPASTQITNLTADCASAQAPTHDLSKVTEAAGVMDDFFNFNTDASASGGATGTGNDLGDSIFDDLLGSDWADGGASGSGDVKSTDFEDWFKDAS